MWIKICGITNQYDAFKTVEAGADSLGFVFYKKSPRHISQASMIGKTLKDKSISFTGVFVNASIREVFEAASMLGLSYLQFCGEEDRGYMQKVRAEAKSFTDLRIIKTIRISDHIKDKEKKQLDTECKDVRDYADYILLDTLDKKIRGGTGKPFEWKVLEGIGKEYPIILSGGLDAENVRDAIRIIDPCGVDASSRLELFPGKKDINKVANFINSVRK
jgi:phosphoribosylanthranilate isomerase